MKAIETKYIGPTNTKGSRVTAWDDAGNRVTLSWRPEMTAEANHEMAVRALCEKIKMPIEEILTGSLKSSLVHLVRRQKEAESILSQKLARFEGRILTDDLIEEMRDELIGEIQSNREE